MKRDEQARRYEEAMRNRRPEVPSFERPARVLAHSDDVETSHEAAAANPHGKATNRRACLAAHRRNPAGLTDDEVRSITGLPDIEANRRCTDLRKLGYIEWLLVDGKPVRRPTRTGRKARVCVLTGAGLR